MNRSLAIFCFLSIWVSYSTMAQVREVKNVPSPEVANLGTFGNVPVGHFTGTPNISVPLYTLKTGKLTLPIEARYHHANVKPHNPPSCLGIGWALSAGGYIARKIKGVQDEKVEDKDSVGFFFNYSKLKEIDESRDKHSKMNEVIKLSKEMGDNTKWFELAADEFTFSFNGYNGTFFMDKNGNWQVVSDDNIKVEFDRRTGFKTIRDLSQRFSLQMYNVSNTKLFFDKFTLITSDGTRYEFGGENAVEYSIPFYNQTNGNLVASCWRLKKITTIDGREVKFEYKADSFMCDIHYAPQKIIFFENGEFSNIVNNTGKSGYSGFLTTPSRLVKISSDNAIIYFKYQENYTYGEMFLQNTDCLYWSDLDDTRYTPGGMDDMISRNRFCQLLGLIGNGDDNAMRDRIAAKIKHYYLSRIYVHTACSDSIGIKMDYKLIFQHRLLSGINFCCQDKSIKEQLENDDESTVDSVDSSISIFARARNMESESEPETEIPDDELSMIIVSDPEAQEEKMDTVYRYRFDYFNTSNSDFKHWWSSRKPLTFTDSWGYYSQYNPNTSNVKEWKLITNQGPVDTNNVTSFGLGGADEYHTKTFVLKSIQYPTGGKSVFDYEQHKYYKIFKVGSGIVYTPTIYGNSAGGIRVKSIKNFDISGNLINSKIYTYSESLFADRSSRSSGILHNPVCFSEKIYLSSNLNDFLEIYSCEQISPYPMNFNSPVVGYSTVYEETTDSNDNRLSVVKYQFSNYDTDINGNSHMDLIPDYTNKVYATYLTAPFTSLAFERGKLLSKETYDKDLKMVHRERYEYNRSSGAPHTIMAHEWYADPRGTRLGMSYLYKAYANKYLVSTIKTEEFNDTNTFCHDKKFQYNSLCLPESESEISSQNQSVTHKYKYTFDNPQYNWITNKNIILPTETETNQNGSKSSEKFTYSPLISSDSIPYISSVKNEFSNGIISKNNTVSVLKADKYGNPVMIEDGGIITILLWGAFGQKLIASIQNATYEEVKTAIGYNPEDFWMNTLMSSKACQYNNNTHIHVSSISNTSVELQIEEWHDNLHNNLKHASVTSYIYDDNLNLICKINPNGIKTLYQYDGFNRLLKESDKASEEIGNVKEFNYKYTPFE